MAAIGVPAALLLGLVAEVLSGLVRALRGTERSWWGGVGAVWTGMRGLVARRETVAAIEAGGLAAGLLGSGLAVSAALGFVPGSAPLVYLSLVLAAAGAHVAASAPTTRAREPRVARARLAAAVAEPAFVLALGATFLRYRASGLEAVLGDQTVLGPGIVLTPVGAAVALGLAGVGLVAAGAARVPPAGEARRGPGRGAGAAVAVGLARWAALGATALVVAALLAGRSLDAPGRVMDFVPFAGAALAAAVVMGLVDGILGPAPTGRARLLAGPAALLVAAAAVVLAVIR